MTKKRAAVRVWPLSRELFDVALYLPLKMWRAYLWRVPAKYDMFAPWVSEENLNRIWAVMMIAGSERCDIKTDLNGREIGRGRKHPIQRFLVSTRFRERALKYLQGDRDCSRGELIKLQMEYEWEPCTCAVAAQKRNAEVLQGTLS